MDKDIELNFKQVKDVIRDMKNTLNDIKEIEEYSSTGDNTGTIILSGTTKYETIKVYNDTIILPPEKVTLKRFYVYFTAFTSATVTILGNITNVKPKKTYKLEIEYVSPFMGWSVFINEMDYKGDIDVDNLILWYNASDEDYYKYDSSPVFLDRMCLNNYNGTKTGYCYCTETDINGIIEPTPEHSFWGGRLIYCNTYLSNGESLIDRFGINLSGFVGDEMSIEIYTIVSSVTARFKDQDILSLGDKNTVCTNCISMRNGSSGYIKIYNESGTNLGGLNRFCTKGLVLYTITISKTDGKAKIYENGTLVSEISVGNNITIGNRLLLGSVFNNTTTTGSAGTIGFKDLRIYNKVLTADQISKHYNVIKLCEGDLE